MTINGKLDVASLQESITVTSQSPTIDLESSKVAVNWDQQKLDELPYSRSLTGLVVAHSRPLRHVARRRRLELRHRLRPGGAHVRPRRRRRGQLRRHDLGPDLRRLRHLRRSADHDGGQGRRRDEPGPDDEPGRQVGQQHVQGPRARRTTSRAISRATTSRTELLAKGYAPGVNKFTKLKDYYGEVGGPILRDRLWFYASHRDASSGNFIPGFVQPVGSRAGGVLHQAAGSDRQDHLPGHARTTSSRAMCAGRPQVAAVSHREPLRAARIDAEPGLVVAGRSVVQVAVDPVAARRRSTPACSAAATGGPTFRGRRTSARPTSRPTTADARRVPRDRSHAAALAVRRAPTPTSPSCSEPQSRAQDRLSRLAQHGRDREHRLSEPAAVPLSQPAGRSELRRSAQLRRLLHASGLGAGLRLPEHHRVGRVVQLGATSTTRSRCRAS